MLDETDRRIVAALAADARISVKALASEIGLSSPSASDRVRRLEERGVIRAFTVDIDPLALGYTLEAIVRIKPLAGMLSAVHRLIDEIPEITECDKVTGDDCFVARLQLRAIDHLDQILARITDKAETSTAIVKSRPVRRRLPPL